MATKPQGVIPYGGWLLSAAATLGFLVAIYDWADKGNGIAYTAGATLVLVSTAIVLAAALALVLDHDKAAWLTGFLYVGLLLGLIGTAVAAYFLYAYWLAGLMIVGLVGWFISVFSDPSDEEIARHAIRKEILSS